MQESQGEVRRLQQAQLYGAEGAQVLAQLLAQQQASFSCASHSARPPAGNQRSQVPVLNQHLWLILQLH